MACSIRAEKNFEDYVECCWGFRVLMVCMQVFAHNDKDHLEALLRRSIAEGQPRSHRPWRKILIVVEGIYSMEGEQANLADIVALKKKYKVPIPCS
jgi:serine palmitoyltransferase